MLCSCWQALLPQVACLCLRQAFWSSLIVSTYAHALQTKLLMILACASLTILDFHRICQDKALLCSQELMPYVLSRADHQWTTTVCSCYFCLSIQSTTPKLRVRTHIAKGGDVVQQWLSCIKFQERQSQALVGTDIAVDLPHCMHIRLGQCIPLINLHMDCTHACSHFLAVNRCRLMDAN